MSWAAPSNADGPFGNKFIATFRIIYQPFLRIDIDSSQVAIGSLNRESPAAATAMPRQQDHDWMDSPKVS